MPADVSLIHTTAFSTNEFALTGKSDPTRKRSNPIPHEVPVADRRNMAFAGTTVATGRAFAVVVATGLRTELGRIAQLSQSAPTARSPLQIGTFNIAKYVSYGVGAVSIVVPVIAVQADLPIKEAMPFAVGFACALIPQGLPAEVNTALASAAGALAKQKALVKRLSSVETLGATHVICTDKTGTLTRNEMTVTELVVGFASYCVTGIGYDPTGRIEPASKFGIDRAALLSGAVEVGELPFDSTRKLMTSMRYGTDGSVTAWVKGAPESILARSSRIDDGTRVRDITDADRAALLALHTEKASRALRNLAFARRSITPADATTGDIAVIEKDLTVLGLVSMIDPIRTAVPEVMADVIAAGVKVNIVTGDFSLTAAAIARQAGLSCGR